MAKLGTIRCHPSHSTQGGKFEDPLRVGEARLESSSSSEARQGAGFEFAKGRTIVDAGSVSSTIMSASTASWHPSIHQHLCAIKKLLQDVTDTKYVWSGEIRHTGALKLDFTGQR